VTRRCRARGNPRSPAKPWVPGKSMGGGGCKRALTRTTAPCPIPSTHLSSATVTRTTSAGAGALREIVNRTSSLAGRGSTAVTRPATVDTCGRSRRGADTASARHQMSASPAAAASPPSARHRPVRVPGSMRPSAEIASMNSAAAAHCRIESSANHVAMPVPNATANHSGNCARSASSQASTLSTIFAIFAGKKVPCAGGSGATTVLGALVHSIRPRQTRGKLA